MIFAEFYHESTGWNGRDFSGPVKLIPKCGTDGVMPMDGRLALRNMVERARSIAKARGLPGFQMMNGATYRGARPLGSFVIVDASKAQMPVDSL